MSALAAAPRGILARIAAISDGAIVRFVFFAMLAGALSVLYVDYRELMDRTAAIVAAPTLPVLPAFDPETPMAAPGPQVTTDPELLRAPLAIALKGGGILQLTGTIDPGAADRFAAEIAARGEYVRAVALDSPGGVVGDALRIGQLLRQHGYDTLVESGAICASSCPLVFAAGVGRTAVPGAAIGVHQIYAALTAGELPRDGLRAAGVAMSDTQAMTAAITRHLTEMGIDPALWLHALETPPDRLYYLSREELERYRLVTPTMP